MAVFISVFTNESLKLTQYNSNTMSAHSTAIGVSSKRGTWGGGHEPLKASYGKLMMWFFLLSDIFTFAAFLITYLAIRVSYPAYAGPAESFVGSNEYWPIPELVFDLRVDRKLSHHGIGRRSWAPK
jgi:heme/copper-type cytochrome/quinol oxidase subunit 3